MNLYICARNPMLYKLRDQHMERCVLRISTDVLDLPEVVVSDGNASSDYVRFAPAPEGLEFVDKEATFAEYWTDEDPFVKRRMKLAKCAEVLVPDEVAPHFILGAYVSSEEGKLKLRSLAADLDVVVDGYMFFRGRR